MESAIRCAGAGLTAIVLWATLQVVSVVWLCGPHHAWLRWQDGDRDVVLDSGERVARPNDAIFLCEHPHKTAAFAWHTDLDCECAPRSLSAEQVGQSLAGSCVVDKPTPTPDDNWGSCQYSRCSDHLE
jgi:hypothetical protein